jgi:hypothetical protein
VETGATSPLVELHWPTADRVVGVSGGDPQSAGAIVDIDPEAGRVRDERSLRATVLDAHAGPHGLTAVLAPPDDIEEAVLLHVDAGGRSRSWPLPGVAAGTVVDRGAEYLLRTRAPGLAVSDADARAFVVAPGRGVRVVEVDLRTGRTAPHDVGSSKGLLRRVSDVLVPDAEAKAGDRAWRQAHWLGRGRLAVTGVDESFDHATGRRRLVPVGLRLVDVRTWEQELVDRHATYAVPVGDDLAVGDGVGERHGVRFEFDPGGRGVRTFSADGTLRWRHGAGVALTPRFVRDRVLHVFDHRARRMRQLDLATGRPAGEPVPPERVPLPLP